MATMHDSLSRPICFLSDLVIAELRWQFILLGLPTGHRTKGGNANPTAPAAHRGCTAIKPLGQLGIGIVPKSSISSSLHPAGARGGRNAGILNRMRLRSTFSTVRTISSSVSVPIRSSGSLFLRLGIAYDPSKEIHSHALVPVRTISPAQTALGELEFTRIPPPKSQRTLRDCAKVRSRYPTIAIVPTESTLVHLFPPRPDLFVQPTISRARKTPRA